MKESEEECTEKGQVPEQMPPGPQPQELEHEKGGNIDVQMPLTLEQQEPEQPVREMKKAAVELRQATMRSDRQEAARVSYRDKEKWD